MHANSHTLIVKLLHSVTWAVPVTRSVLELSFCLDLLFLSSAHSGVLLPTRAYRHCTHVHCYTRMGGCVLCACASKSKQAKLREHERVAGSQEYLIVNTKAH